MFSFRTAVRIPETLCAVKVIGIEGYSVHSEFWLGDHGWAVPAIYLDSVLLAKGLQLDLEPCVELA